MNWQELLGSHTEVKKWWPANAARVPPEWPQDLHGAVETAALRYEPEPSGWKQRVI